MDLKKIGVIMRNWIDLAQDRNFWRAIMNVGSVSHGVSGHGLRVKFET